MCMFVYISKDGIHFPVTGVTDSCPPPEMGAGREHITSTGAGSALDQ